MDIERNSLDLESNKPNSLDRHSDLELSWNDLTYVAPKRQQPILNHLHGTARSGELLAVMGPSGAGKSTFLDAICGRSSATGEVTVNGSKTFSTQDLFSFVEQDDALLGVLTVRETVAFAAYLSLGSSYPGIDRHIDDTLRSLGLQDIAGNRIGTPLSRGISGGQKRRVTIACSVVTKPHILVLDEPTSGLDASSSREVVTFLRYLAHDLNMLVICTIHQPNFETFSLFDKLLVLAGGLTMYNGPVADLDSYLTWTGSPTPKFCNPADHVVQLVNTEFLKSEGPAQHRSAQEHLTHYSESWTQFDAEKSRDTVTQDLANPSYLGRSSTGLNNLATDFRKLSVLMHRNLLNYSRNLLAYGIRLAMYCGMGLLLATIWIHLGYSADKINDRLSVSFFAVAFLGFMSVAGIPSFLEERSVFVRERRNGLYGSGVYVLAQSIVSIPFLFLCSLVFALIIYWSIGMNPGATHFFRFLVYLFLALYTAESQSLLVAAVFPLFVAALAIASFANGLWMCNMGYFIRTTSLPRFWFYVVHWIDYQTFSFNLLVKNDFAGRVLQCSNVAGVCGCPIPSSLTPAQCALAGDDVVRNLNISGSEGMSVGLLILICVVFRVLFYLGLRLRK